MKVAKLSGGIIGVAGIVLLVVSIIQRDAGVFWMPVMFFVGLVLELAAVIMITYEPEEAKAVRARMDEQAMKEAAART